MVQLNAESIYEKLTEEEAKAKGQHLFRGIWRRTFISKAKGTMTDDEAKHIHKHMSAISEDPYGYFYLLIKLTKSKRQANLSLPDHCSWTVLAGRSHF